MARPRDKGQRCVVCGRVLKDKDEVVDIGKGLRRHRYHRTTTIIKAYAKINKEFKGAKDGLDRN